MQKSADRNSASEPKPAPVFAALGDPTRLALIAKLSSGEPRSISDLAEDFPLTRQGITKHLRILEQAGMVHCVRVGRESRYALDPAPIAEVREYLDQVSRQWDRALARLKAFVEDSD